MYENHLQRELVTEIHSGEFTCPDQKKNVNKTDVSLQDFNTTDT